MRLLFLAFAISFCALLWVAFSVTRHILRHEQQGAGATEAPIEGAQRTGLEQNTDLPPGRPRPRYNGE